jgi:hypothetical protein
MRQIFSSPRLENVEGVAKMLEEAGIQTKTSESRGYKKVSRREFSYVPAKASQDNNPPSVWVVNSDDYKRARELLHEAGLLDEARTSSYLPEPMQFKQAPPVPQSQRISRVRMALLFAVGAMACWTIAKMFLLR